MKAWLPSVGWGAAVLFGVVIAAARPPASPDPDKCRDAFRCGALSAHLAAQKNDYAGAFRAIRRGCDIETRAPVQGDSLFACEQYAELLISAGKARGGDPALGIAMLERMCKERPVSVGGDPSPCSTLAREYDAPPRASGLPRRTDRAAVIHGAACDHADALACSSLAKLYLKGGPGLAADVSKARASMERGCALNGHYAAGVCGELGKMISAGELGAPPNRSAAMPYLAKSCAQGYRCDLYVELLLREGRDAEAVRAFERPGAFAMKDEWASKYCREGFKVMCGRVATGGATY